MSAAPGPVEYEYAWLSARPWAHLPQEFPVGLVLHARATDFLAVRYERGLAALAGRLPAAELDTLRAALEGYARICAGGAAGGPIGLLPPGERFHWLVAPRSAVVRCSEVYGGRAADPGAVLERLDGEAFGGGAADETGWWTG